jgi:hypothetical protein
MQNIALFSITIVEEGNSGIPVRIIFNFCHPRGDIELIALEVNHPVETFVTTTPVTAGNDTSIIPSLGIVLVGSQGFFWL